MTQSRNQELILQELKDSPFQKVKVAMVDMDGVMRGKYMHKDKFLSAVDGGFGFCDVVFGWDIADVCYDNIKITGWHSGYPDAQATVDLNTYREIPWEDGQPFFLADFADQGKGPAVVCPRQLLKKTVAKAASMGFVPKVGPEFEFFNFNETPQSLAEKGFQNLEPLTPGMFGYSVLRAGLNRDYFTALMDDLLAFDIPLEGLHTETGPGVYEAAIAVTNALESADRAALFKTSAKEIAYEFGAMPTFMAKINMTLPGCSGHLHQSLWDDKEEDNLFYDPDDKNKMSPLFKSYLAGQLKLLPELLPFYAPTINSYKRLVEGHWAPTRVTWGVDNRTVAFRIIPGSAKSTRVEMRVTGSDINPYLAMSAAIASGLYGIENGLSLDLPQTTGNGYQANDAEVLPKDLVGATQRLADSKIAHEILGDDFVDHFVRTRRWEARQAHETVTDWELKRYFELV